MHLISSVFQHPLKVLSPVTTLHVPHVTPLHSRNLICKGYVATSLLTILETPTKQVLRR